MSANDAAKTNQSHCLDCGGSPRFRQMVSWVDNETDVEHTTTCTSSFHQIVKREAGAYEYLSDTFEVLHVTSVPMTDQEALEYFSWVQTCFPEKKPTFIQRRPLDGHTFEMMEFFYDAETKEVRPLVEWTG